MDMIERQFGTDVREKYVFYDPCCGTKNLTRDYRFKELYCSTLEQAELDIGSKYNPEAVSFQFDFLNDPLEKLPEGLKKALAEKKKITFLMNPPYGTAGEAGANGKSKKGICRTVVNEQMKKEKLGNASEQLFAQFLYRIMTIKKQFGLTDCNLAFFCNPNFLTGSAYKKFRELFLNEFKFEGGFLFSAMHFADCSANWGINFSIWKTGKTENKTSFAHTLIDFDENGDISETGTKTIYNIGNQTSINEWTKEPVKKLKTEDEVNLTSAIKVSAGNTVHSGKNFKDNFGFYHTNGANCASNAQGVSIMSAAFNHGHGHGINTDNFTRCCSAFAARRLIKGDWINDKD